MCSENDPVRPYVQHIRAQHRARTADAIDAAVLRELGLRGYAGLRLADVALRARVALRTVHLHGGTKEDLIASALRRRATSLARRVERWRPPGASAGSVVDELVALHERTYRGEKALLEALVDSGAPGAGPILRSLDHVRLSIITRTVADLARRGALRARPTDAAALAHALLAYPTWRTALTGPAGRRAPRLLSATLRTAILGSS